MVVSKGWREDGGETYAGQFVCVVYVFETVVKSAFACFVDVCVIADAIGVLLSR